MRWFVSLLCALLSFGLLLSFGMVAGAALPALLELLPSAPHLAMLGALALVLSPALVIALAHRVGSGVLDALEGRAGKPSASSLAAGAHGWLVLIGTSALTAVVLMVIHPPALEPESLSVLGLAARLFVAQTMSLHAAIWVTIATVFFELHRRGQRVLSA